MRNSFDFTDLVLLVGTNPLPNYVVGKYFSRCNRNLKRIWLIYSEEDIYRGTKQYANDIKTVLEKETGGSIKIEKEPISDVGHGSRISKEIREILSPKRCEAEEVHLNYTGGTKAMSVHVYRELEKLWKDKFSASYLDARDFSIKFDDNLVYDDTEDLRRTIDISWDDLFKLHNTQKITEKKDMDKEYPDYINPEEIENIQNKLFILVENGKVPELKEWNKQLIELLKKLKDIKENKELAYETIYEAMNKFSFNDNRILFEFLASFPEEDQFIDKNGKLVHENFCCYGKRKEKLVSFLNGKWLESYVYHVVKKMKPECEPLLNYKLVPISTDSKSEKDFEMDVIIKNGYQVCGISCATDTKQGDLKDKGFEVILRSRQMGGDEARSILVTLLDKKIDISRFERDLKASAGSGYENFIVLGIDDLPPDRMWGRIRKHVFEEVV